MIAVTTHALTRFAERVAPLPDDEARAVIRAALAAHTLPGPYEPQAHYPCHSPFRFVAVVTGPDGVSAVPTVVTIKRFGRSYARRPRL